MSGNIGLENAHCDILSHIHIDYTREQLKMDMEKLGTMTKGQIVRKQKSPGIRDLDDTLLFEDILKSAK